MYDDLSFCVVGSSWVLCLFAQDLRLMIWTIRKNRTLPKVYRKSGRHIQRCRITRLKIHFCTVDGAALRDKNTCIELSLFYAAMPFVQM